MKVLAIIPARGGSKRLPNKNILDLCGKPLIAWSISAAKKSKYVNDIIVSTDDIEIAKVAKKYGANVPELRPEELASDTATTQSVIMYTLEKFGKDADLVIILQPTSPLRDHIHLDQAIELYLKKGAFSVVSVTPCEHSPLWSNTLPEDRCLKDFLRVDQLKRSQDLEQYFRLNGAIYIYNAAELSKLGVLEYGKSSYAYVMDRTSSIDIDDYMDFKMAKFFLLDRLGNNH